MAAENQSKKIFERSERTAREGLDMGAASLMLGCWTWRRPMAWRRWSSFAS